MATWIIPVDPKNSAGGMEFILINLPPDGGPLEVLGLYQGEFESIKGEVAERSGDLVIGGGRVFILNPDIPEKKGSWVSVEIPPEELARMIAKLKPE